MIDIRTPIAQEGTKAIVRTWLKNIGDHVEKDEPLVELETDKVAMEVAAPVAGILIEIILQTEQEALPNALLGRMSVAARSDPLGSLSSAAPEESGKAALEYAPTVGEQRLSPAVRRAALEYGIDPNTLRGSGRGGRITRADVDSAVAERVAVPVQAAALPPLNEKLAPSLAGSHSVPHDRMRKAIAQNMLNSVAAAPHVTAIFEADFSSIMAHRTKHKPAFEKEGVNLTFTAYFIAAVVSAMRVAPAINSRWHDDRLEFFDNINIGVGTALGDKGLIVPVVHRAQELSLVGIAARLQDLIARARINKLTTSDVTGGTFSISNHGVSGSLLAAPIIISQPQSAILGVGKVEKRVVVREVNGVDTIQIRPLSYVSLTIDHRVVDGHQTNAWLSRFVETIEKWPLDA